MKKALIFILILLLVAVVVLYFAEFFSGTFTAEVDGEPFKGEAAYATFADGWLDVNAAERSSGEMRMIMLRLRCSSPGSFALNSDDVMADGGASYTFGKSKDQLTIFSTTRIYTGLVTISVFDADRERVSGTFEFSAVQISQNGNRIVKGKGTFTDVPVKNSLSN